MNWYKLNHRLSLDQRESSHFFYLGYIEGKIYEPPQKKTKTKNKTKQKLQKTKKQNENKNVEI